MISSFLFFFVDATKKKTNPKEKNANFCRGKMDFLMGFLFIG
jgi:hypothetical protein